MRGALDRLAARAAAQTLTDTAANRTARRTAEERLQTPLEAGRQAVAEGRVPALIEADIAFHQTIYSLSDNPLIAQSAEVHWFHIRRIMGAVLRDHNQRNTVWREHQAIADAILAGDVERAGALAEAHVEAAAAMLIGRLEDRLALSA